ncbi:MAG: c-type cytochrome [Gammaproteobacteria bacterium]
MTAKSLFLYLLAVPLLAFAPGAYADGSQIDAGRDLYVEFCEKCHGANKSGLNEFTDDLAKFTERLDEGMTEEMPDFAGFFEEDEIAAMYAYLAEPETGAE